MTSVKLLVAPLHGPSWQGTVGERAFQSAADFVLWTEGYKAWPWLSDHGNSYRSFTAQGTKTDNRGRVVGHDVIISVKDDWTVVAHGGFWVDAEIDPDKYTPERHGVWVVAKKGDLTVLAISAHPQPGHSANINEHYSRSMDRLVAQCADRIKQYSPDLVLSGGDMQRSGVGVMQTYAKMGLDSDFNGIIWSAWSKGWTKKSGWTIDAPALFSGLDHPWEVREITK